MRRSGGWNEEVRDDQGRRRFHGAFTGGFSAGYFNSVGSEEGWKPKSFSSSRQERSIFQQRAEDFMDEEDDPLLGRRLETSEKYDTLQNNIKQSLHQARSSGPMQTAQPIPAFTLPDEWVLPASESIGAKLLQHMGWKEGQGIGPRIRKRKFEDGSNQHHSNKATNDDDEVYVPPRKTVDASVFPKPKVDQYGAGFDPYTHAPEFAQYKQRQQEQQREKATQKQVLTFADAMKATTGSYRTATDYGLGALEENDDLDVYGTTSMNEFDRAIGPSTTSAMKRLDSEARESMRKNTKKKTTSQSALCYDGRPCLPGFELTRVKEKTPKSVVLRLQVPSNFQPHHHLEENEEQADSIGDLYRRHNFSTEKHGRGSLMTAKQRAVLLGETTQENAPSTRSVFDMMSKDQKAKLMQAAAHVRQRVQNNDEDELTVDQKQRQHLIDGAGGDQFRATISASIAKRFISAGQSTKEDTAPTDPIPMKQSKPSYRTESSWIPTTLLCKRFHVKCVLGAGSGNDNAQEGRRDLFDQELVPHLVEYAAGRAANRGINTQESGKSAEILTQNLPSRTEGEEEDLPPLPIVKKPATELLKSIFEPSDESEVEDESSSDENEDNENKSQSMDDRKNDIEFTRISSTTGSGRSSSNLKVDQSSKWSASSDGSSSSESDGEIPSKKVTTTSTITKRKYDGPSSDEEDARKRKHRKKHHKKHHRSSRDDKKKKKKKKHKDTKKSNRKASSLSKRSKRHSRSASRS